MAIKKNSAVKVKQDENEPIPAEIIATSIVAIDSAFKQLMNAGLNEDAIVTLLIRMLPNGIVRWQVQAILRALPRLRQTFCTK
jgi:hypothetical protein